MWSYYGRKAKIINKYPKPLYNVIIEPFAGTASYSYKYWDRDIIISDTYDVVYKIWIYLQNTTKDTILSLPDVENGECIKNKYHWLCDEERWLIGFSINNASEMPKHTAGRMNFNSWKRDKVRIANDLYKIKHWKILNKCYRDIENKKATWYIDPPYQFQNRYVCNNICYNDLASYCLERKGQIIVCENNNANWLNFSELTQLPGQRTRTTEVMFYRENNE